MTETKQQEILHDWLNRHKGLFFKVVRAYAHNEEDRDDLFQEITLQVWRSIPNFRGESAETTWIYRIAFNTAIRWHSKERKHQEGRQSMESAPVLEAQSKHQDERLTWLYEQIGKLSEVEKSLCLLLLDGFSYKEMSNIVGISESNVAVKIHRIKKYLQEQSEKMTANNGI
ncbi:RNA polymerase sigma factor [Marinoscillum pacificum]|uniref:RNA polymerase sigma factor n=1 Tax=Marinoscillum pacificum TaxID=392723 RepID=UPI002156FC20|nr:RNA polymerase sigma factor [Marinoscillum pacificum]